MHKNHVMSSACVLALALSGAGCLRDESLDTNRDPIANAGEDQQHEFSGEPVTVTLNGTKSRDLDGEIAEYEWRPVVLDASDGGMTADASAAAGTEDAVDPRNVAKPKLELGRGTYHFTLWVRDDDGALSKPDTVTVKIGGDPVQECIAGAFDGLDDGCRQCLCDQDEACQMAVPNCSGDCWGLIGCIAGLCPTFTMDMDTACVIANCARFVAGGQSGAMAAGACVQPCATECTASLTAIVTGGG
ncbi:MAG TPA: hypothetical protein VK509_14985 [Polyangiales bacterium]|nr:hypothetical protein [Polyangiales bacterium]